jgi:hypothetical protein
MKLGFYLFAEYINMFVSSAIISALFFGGYNIPFQEYDVETDANAALRMQKLGGGGGIPFAVINGSTIEGFSAYRYSSALH